MLLVWVAAGALTWFGASICAELSSAFPQTGGVYVFLREMFSPAIGFLWGWAMFWSMHSGIIAAIAMVFGRYAATIVPLSAVGDQLHRRPSRQPRADRADHREDCGDSRAAGDAFRDGDAAHAADLGRHL